MNTSDDQGSAVPAVERALNILEFIGYEKNQPTVKEVSEKLSIPIASTARIIKSLVSRGYLVENKGSSSTFSLGLNILHLSQLVIKHINIAKHVHPYMRILSDSTNQTSQLAIMQQNAVIYIEQVLPKRPVSIIAPLHTPIALNTSASGKVLCAWRNKEQQKAIIETAELVRCTDNSIIEKEKFYQELADVRNKGYGLDIEEFAIGIGCIAAPILDYTREIIAAIGITGHISAYRKPAELEKLILEIRVAADKISNEIGYK